MIAKRMAKGKGISNEFKCQQSAWLAQGRLYQDCQNAEKWLNVLIVHSCLLLPPCSIEYLYVDIKVQKVAQLLGASEYENCIQITYLLQNASS